MYVRGIDKYTTVPNAIPKFDPVDYNDTIVAHINRNRKRKNSTLCNASI